MKGAFFFFVALRLAVADPQSCAVKGVVTDALTHQGLRKAYVRLGEYPAVTDDRGAFTIENIKPERIRLQRNARVILMENTVRQMARTSRLNWRPARL